MAAMPAAATTPTLAALAKAPPVLVVVAAAAEELVEDVAGFVVGDEDGAVDVGAGAELGVLVVTTGLEVAGAALELPGAVLAGAEEAGDPPAPVDDEPEP